MGILFLVVLVRLFAKIFRTQLPTLLFTLLLVLGVNIAEIAVPIFKKISAWLPMTYLNAVDSASGYLGLIYQNSHLNFASGIIVLLFSTIVILGLTFIIESLQKF